MYFIKRLLIILVLFSFNYNHLAADTPYFLDFKKILNQSDAGKKHKLF